MQRVKKDDQVRVISGRARGREGRVLGFTHGGDRVLVEGLNLVKKHQRPTQSNPRGGIVEKEAGIDVSNVMPLTPSGRPTRVQFRLDEDGRKKRYSKRYDEYLDE